MKDIISENRQKIRSVIKRTLGFYNEDIEQEVYVHALARQNEYLEQGKITAWLMTIASNLCKDYFKSSYFKGQTRSVDVTEIELYDEKAVSQEEITDVKQRQKIILKAVDALPKKLREVVILYEFEEYSYEDIAQKLNISIGTVKSRLFNARTILSQKLSYLKGE